MCAKVGVVVGVVVGWVCGSGSGECVGLVRSVWVVLVRVR